MFSKLKSKLASGPSGKRSRAPPTISAPIPIAGPCLPPQPTHTEAWAALAAAYEAKAYRPPASTASSVSSAPSSCCSSAASTLSSTSAAGSRACPLPQRPPRPDAQLPQPGQPRQDETAAQVAADATEAGPASPANARSSAASSTSWDVLQELIDDHEFDDAASVYSRSSIETDYEHGQYTIKRAEVVSL